MSQAEELAALRRFHALFADRKGQWAGAEGAMTNAREVGTDLWREWQKAAEAMRREHV